MGQVGMRAAGDIAGTMGTPEFATMLQLGSAAIGAAVGEGSGAAAALAGTQYNYLTHLQTQQFEDKLAACGNDKACQDDARQWAKNASLNNDIAMAGMCGANPSDTHCLQAIKDSTRYNLNSNMHTLIADDQMRSTNALLQMAFDIPGGAAFLRQHRQPQGFLQHVRQCDFRQGG